MVVCSFMILHSSCRYLCIYIIVSKYTHALHTTINCTYISNTIGEKSYFPMAGNILPKVNVSSASWFRARPVQKQSRGLSAPLYSLLGWGWQGSAHTQLRRRQCSLGGSAVCLSGALVGLCSWDRVPWQPSCTQARCLLRIRGSSLFPSPRISTCCHRPCVLTLSGDLHPQKRLSLPLQTHALLPAPEQMQGPHFRHHERPHARRKGLHEFCRWDSGVAS